MDPEEDWDGAGGPATVWAEPIEGKEWEHFRIMNSPFHVKGVSFLDVVKASFIAGSNLVFNFEAVVERGGHSTFMILMVADDPRNEAYWNMLERMGCSYESGTIDSDVGPRLLYSVDVPPITDIHDVYEMLERGKSDNVWIFQEGFVSPAHKTQDSRLIRNGTPRNRHLLLAARNPRAILQATSRRKAELDARSNTQLKLRLQHRQNAVQAEQATAAR